MVEEVNYLLFAETQIHKAIDLYLEDNLQGYICSLSLSGSAEGLLGGYLGDNKASYALKKFVSEKTGLPEKEVIDELNKPYNSLKHFKGIGEFKPVDHSIVMLMRAIQNYSLSFSSVTEKMYEFFQNEKVQKDLKGL